MMRRGPAKQPNPSYVTVHTRLFRDRGRAGEHRCEVCGNQAYEWAYDHNDPNERYDERGHPYTENLEHYRAVCRPCHREIDRKDVCRKGHLFTQENTYLYGGFRFCRTCRRIYSNKYYHTVVRSRQDER